MDSHNHIYLYNNANQSFHKVDLHLTPTPNIYSTTGAVTTMSNSLVSWVADEQHNYIYGINNDAKLLYINKNNLHVEKELQLTAPPSDIILYKNKLYISSSEATGVDIVDTSLGISVKTPTGHIEVHSTAYQIEVDDYHIYTVSKGVNQGEPIKSTHIQTGITTRFPGSYYNPDLLIDHSTGSLFIGETLSNLYQIDTLTNTVISYTNYSGSYNKNNLLLDKGILYFSGRSIDPDQPSTENGVYVDNNLMGSDSIVYVKENLVFTNTAIFDRDSYSKIADLRYYIHSAYVDKNGSIYLAETTNGKSTIRKINSLLDLTGKYNDFSRPGKPTFIDENNEEHIISGTLSFTSARDEH